MNRIAEFQKVSLTRYAHDLVQSSDHMNLSEKRISEIYDAIKLPMRATSGSAGYDFFAPYDFELEAGESIKIPTGIRAKMSEGWVLFVFPRSSLGFKYRLRLDNTVGVIDQDYYGAENEGHILIKITNESKNKEKLYIKSGNAFAQGIFVQYGITYDDAVSDMRKGGFGSTNI